MRLYSAQQHQLACIPVSCCSLRPELIASMLGGGHEAAEHCVPHQTVLFLAVEGHVCRNQPLPQ